MSVLQYDIFVKSAELGSLTLAAEALGCTQSNASHAISALEKELGLILMQRKRSGVRLTPEGERLLGHMKQICQGEAMLQEEARQLRMGENGKLRVGSFTSVAVHWLPEIIKRFQALYPRIEFELLNGDYHDVDEWLRSGKVDAAFTRLPSSLPCRLIPLYEDRLMAILPLHHAKAKLSAFPISEMRDEPFISLLESSDHDSARLLRDAGVQPDIRFSTKDDYALIAMVANGLGVSIVPELLLMGRADSIAAVPLDPPMWRSIALAIPQSSENRPAVKRFGAFMEEWSKELNIPTQPFSK